MKKSKYFGMLGYGRCGYCKGDKFNNKFDQCHNSKKCKHYDGKLQLWRPSSEIKEKKCTCSSGKAWKQLFSIFEDKDIKYCPSCGKKFD